MRLNTATIEAPSAAAVPSSGGTSGETTASAFGTSPRGAGSVVTESFPATGARGTAGTPLTGATAGGLRTGFDGGFAA